jgi:hypothetical protein
MLETAASIATILGGVAALIIIGDWINKRRRPRR